MGVKGKDYCGYCLFCFWDANASYLRTTLYSFPAKLESQYTHVMWLDERPRPCPCLGKLSGSFQARHINVARSVETAGAFGLMGITSTTSSGKTASNMLFGRFHQRRRTSSFSATHTFKTRLDSHLYPQS